MNTYLHKGTCRAWETGTVTDCNCRPLWRIHRELEFHLWGKTDPKMKWTVSRFLDGRYESFLTCDTFEAATQLVESMLWLRQLGLRREPNAR